MILLTAITDKVQIITSTASSCDYHTSYMDMSTADPPVVKGSTSGRTNGNVASAGATTDIVPVPGASTIRNVKQIFVRNKDATLACDVTVQFNQNATLIELCKITLLPGQTLEYNDEYGFFVLASTAKVDYKLRVANDVVFVTAATFADITGLTCAVVSGKQYNFEAHLYHISNATTTGAQFGIGGVAMTNMRIQELDVILGSLTAATMGSPTTDVTAVNTAAIAEGTGAATVVLAILSGWFNPSASGTFAIRGTSEVTVAAGLTIKQGSWARIWEADN